jgi:hypothetical protein
VKGASAGTAAAEARSRTSGSATPTHAGESSVHKSSVSYRQSIYEAARCGTAAPSLPQTREFHRVKGASAGTAAAEARSRTSGSATPTHAGGSTDNPVTTLP